MIMKYAISLNAVPQNSQMTNPIGISQLLNMWIYQAPILKVLGHACLGWSWDTETKGVNWILPVDGEYGW